MELRSVWIALVLLALFTDGVVALRFISSRRGHATSDMGTLAVSSKPEAPKQGWRQNLVAAKNQVLKATFDLKGRLKRTKKMEDTNSPPPLRVVQWTSLNTGNDISTRLTVALYKAFRSFASVDLAKITEEPAVFLKGKPQRAFLPDDKTNPVYAMLRYGFVSGTHVHFGRVELFETDNALLSENPKTSSLDFYLVFSKMYDVLKECAVTAETLKNNKDYWKQWKFVIDVNTGDFCVRFGENGPMLLFNMKEILETYVTVPQDVTDSGPTAGIKSNHFRDLSAHYLKGPCSKCERFAAIGGAVGIARQFLSPFHVGVSADFKTIRSTLEDAKTKAFARWKPVIIPTSIDTTLKYDIQAVSFSKEGQGSMLVQAPTLGGQIVEFSLQKDSLKKMPDVFRSSPFLPFPGSLVWKTLPELRLDPSVTAGPGTRKGS